MTAEDYKKFYENVKTHVEMMATPEMRKHAFASEEHDLDFQIMRFLSGYDAALQQLKENCPDKEFNSLS